MPEIIVTFPTGGETLRKGSVYEITWETKGDIGTDFVRINLYDTGGLVETFTFYYENSGSYFWTVSENIDNDNDYYIRVRTNEIVPPPVPIIGDSSVFTITDRFTISEFSRLDNLRKVVLIEIKAGIEISMEGWTAYSSSGGPTGIYSIGYTGPELVDIEENKITLKRYFSISECIRKAGSYFHDFQNQILYLHTIGSEDPATSGLFFVGYTWLCFTNTQEQLHTIDFIPQNATQSVYYRPLLDVSSIPALTQRVSDYYKSAVSIQFGNLSFLNDGWFWENRKTYLWHNKNAFVKVGERDSQYDEFITIFPGRSRKPYLSDEKVIISIKDRRVGDLKQIPEDRFDTITYPNLDPDYENEIIPILFGTKTNLTPPSIDTVNWIYKISQTLFNGVAYSISNIDAVYKDGVPLVEGGGADWTSDDANGQFTLINDPGTSVITCDAKGIECQYDFTTGLPTGNFSENTADILFFVLTELNNIPINDIDWASFLALQTQRTQRTGWWLNEAMHTNDFVRILQAIAFHLIPTLDGRYMVRYYDRDISADAKLFRTDDYFLFDLFEDTDTAFKFVVLKYDFDHTLGTWKKEIDSEDETEYKHDEKNTLTIETALLNQAEAQTFLTFYMNMVRDPGDKIKVQVGGDAFDSIPSDKAYFSKRSLNDKKQEIEILDEEIYVILELVKSAESGKVNILGLSDTQAEGIIVHTDTPHEDEHTDDHVDEHQDEYTDEAYIDEYEDVHEDIAHTDSHSDVPHSDEHTDIPYDDTAHDDVPHTDVPYTDEHIDHEDAGYVDSHDDSGHGDVSHEDIPHTDTPHTDTHSDSHSDSHSDTPHTDTHTDEHGDGHNDVYVDEYIDEHTDEHTDVPHADSEL